MRNQDLRSAHNETASTHNKSVARATEPVVRTASTCGCMLHGVVDGCCSPVVQLHVAVVAVSHQLLWPLQQLLAVL